MKLYGTWHSPFVRRVGITLGLYGIPYTLVETLTSERATLLPLNPLGRVPALALDNGEVLIDSTMIVDCLDELVGPARALTPPAGPRRRAVQRVVAVALGVADKYLAAYHEETKRPESHRWQPWRDRLADQVDGGLEWLEARLADRDGRPRFFRDAVGDDALTQAEVTTVAALEAIRFDVAHLAPRGRWPRLDALCESVSEIPAFSETKPVQAGP